MNPFKIFPFACPKLILLALLCLELISSDAFAQSEKVTAATASERTPELATDEYGIPLKLESPKKVLPQTVRHPNQANGRRRLKPKHSKSPPSKAIAPEALENQAMKELAVPKKDLSVGILPTPATVRLHVEEVKNPVRPLAYRLGVSIQPLTLNGTMTVGSLTPYDLSKIGTNAMVALDGQWLPLEISSVPGLQVGAFVSFGYAQFNYQLRSPAGVSLDDAKLQAVKAQFGPTASYQLPRSPLWSLHGNVGLGRLLELQSSPTSAAANTSETTDFASLGTAAERSLLSMGLSNLSVYLGYDFKLLLSRSTPGADVPSHSLLVGFLGNFE